MMPGDQRDFGSRALIFRGRVAIVVMILAIGITR